MSRLITCFALIAIVLLIAAPRADAQDHPGVKVYASQKCGICHSVAGVGNKKFPLDGIGTKLTEAQIREWLVNPVAAAKKANSTAKPPMKSYEKLPSAELDALVAYMLSLKK
jgi:mono/diheme cytochrome c family protein